MRTAASPERSISFVTVGDIAVVKGHEQGFAHGDVSPFEEVLQKLKGDVVMGNLEAPLTTADNHFPGKCCLRMHPTYAHALSRAGFTVLSLANNHILDYHHTGVEDTLHTLEQFQIRSLGYGATHDIAASPILLDKEGITLGILAYCDVTIDSPFFASQSVPGIPRFDLAAATRAVQMLRPRVHHVVICLHWGYENFRYPSPQQRAAAHALIDAGADLIIGHHPHVLQGIETYRDRIIAYSLGNFAFTEFDWTYEPGDGRRIPQRIVLPPDWRESAILAFRASRSALSLEHTWYTRIDGNDTIRLDLNPRRVRNHLRQSKGLSSRLYLAYWWLEILRNAWSLHLSSLFRLTTLSRLHRIRPRHLHGLVEFARQTFRSSGFRR